jgi:hypothetical protein
LNAPQSTYAKKSVYPSNVERSSDEKPMLSAPPLESFQIFFALKQHLEKRRKH